MHTDVKIRIIYGIIALMLVVAPPRAQARQGGTTRFVYDDNGRLTAVIAENGEAAVYDYDAAGNFTAIRRISADMLTLLAFFPHEGGAGDQVTFVGTGFNTGATSVSFNGAAAQIASVSPSAVVAVVPDAATSGPVVIVTPRGTLVTPVPFGIVARVRVFPQTATLMPGDTVVFTAVVAGLAPMQSASNRNSTDTSLSPAGVGGPGDQVTWAVNGVAGGDSTVGTILPSGLYTAPTNLTGNASLSVTVRATSIAQPTLFGEAHVRVLNPNSLAIAFAHSLSVSRGDPPGVRASRAPMVSVRRGPAISGPGIALSALVSVRRGVIISAPAPFRSPPVSLRFGFAPGAAPSFFSQFVSVTNGPTISNISPGNLSRGSTATLTISGANLVGASALRFINSSGAIDTAISASNLTMNAEGTQLTATVTVSSGAATGLRVAVVTAATGTTPAVAAGFNTLTIQ